MDRSRVRTRYVFDVDDLRAWQCAYYVVNDQRRSRSIPRVVNAALGRD